jgi:hypothetical protein
VIDRTGKEQTGGQHVNTHDKQLGVQDKTAAACALCLWKSFNWQVIYGPLLVWMLKCL